MCFGAGGQQPAAPVSTPKYSPDQAYTAVDVTTKPDPQAPASAPASAADPAATPISNQGAGTTTPKGAGASTIRM